MYLTITIAEAVQQIRQQHSSHKQQQYIIIHNSITLHQFDIALTIHK